MHFIPVSVICTGHYNLLFPADITVICPWEAFNHLELNELAKYGII